MFATLLILIQHSAQLYFGDNTIIDPTLGPRLLYYIVQYVASLSVPLFVFISGYLYYLMRVEKQKYSDYAEFIKSKFVRLIVPFYLFAFLYFIPAKWLLGLYQTPDLPTVIITQLTAGGQNVVWFLFMLFWVFAIFYLVEDRLNKIGPVFTIAILGALSIVSGFFPTTMQIQTVLTYSIFFYLGYKLRSKHEVFEKQNTIWAPILFVSHLSLFILIQKTHIFMDFPLRQLALLTLSVVGVFAAYSVASVISSKVNFGRWRAFQFIDRNSLLIYLLHEPIILTFLFFFGQRIHNYYLIAVVSFIVGLLLSCIFAVILTKWRRFREMFYSSGYIEKRS